MSDQELEIISEINKTYSVTSVGGFSIIEESKDSITHRPTFNLISRQSFINRFENKSFIDHEGKTKKQSHLWLRSPHRKEFPGGIVFEPTKNGHFSEVYNLWSGFSIVPSPRGSCERFKEHIFRVVCNRNQRSYDYVWRWCACIIQKPDEIHTALVLMGLQGTGKGVFVQTLGKLIENHFVQIDALDRLLGKFNSHLSNAVLVFADEAVWGGNRKDVGRLKSMITEKRQLIEQKGKDAISVKNCKHFIFASNEEWPVHIDPDDRRFFVLKVNDSRKEDIFYFEQMQKELDSNGYEKLLHELLQEDISSFDPKIIPTNIDSFSVKLLSAPNEHRFIFTALNEGSFRVFDIVKTWEEEIGERSLYLEYALWCDHEGIKISGKEDLMKTLKKLIPSAERYQSTHGTRLWKLTNLEVSRHEFCSKYKLSPTEIGWE